MRLSTVRHVNDEPNTNNKIQGKKMRFGNVKIENPLLLAPMEAVTNSVFRRIVKPFGPSLMFTEFTSSMGLLYGRDALWSMVRFHESERPLAIQIFGGDPNVMSECAKRMEDLGPDILDINCGCSVPKMKKANAGAYLTRDRAQLQGVMEAVVAAVKIPVTLKIRKGWDDQHVTSFEIARMAEALGFAAVTIHGRTSVQGYTGKADWETIDEVARSVKIPVVGSGDMNSPEAIHEKLSTTAVSAVMIGRGVMGNPWLFREALHYLKTGTKLHPPTPSEKLQLVLAHLKLSCEELGEIEGFREMRKHLTWYIRDLPNAAATRASLQTAPDRSTAESLLRTFFEAKLSSGQFCYL